MNPKEIIFSHIADGDLDKAFERCLAELPLDSDLRNCVVTLSSHFHHLERQISIGVLSHKNTKTDRSQIVNGLTSLLNTWNPGGEQSALETELGKLKFDSELDFGVSHLFNADRTRAKRTFKNNFDDKKDKEHFQFYFLCACPEEKPESFAKRVLYELIETECNNHKDFVKYKNQDGEDYILPESLPCGDDLKDSMEKFRAFFARRFSFSDAQTFDGYLETGLPALEHRYVAFVFEVSEQKWKDDLEEPESEILRYLRWLADTFEEAKAGQVTFLFFIAVRSQNLWVEAEKHSPLQKKILAELEQLCEKRPKCALIRAFPPVGLDDAKEWLREHGARQADNEAEILASFAKTLKPERQQFVQEEKKIHMKDLEALQRMIFKRAKI